MSLPSRTAFSLSGRFLRNYLEKVLDFQINRVAYLKFKLKTPFKSGKRKVNGRKGKARQGKEMLKL